MSLSRSIYCRWLSSGHTDNKVKSHAWKLLQTDTNQINQLREPSCHFVPNFELLLCIVHMSQSSRAGDLGDRRLASDRRYPANLDIVRTVDGQILDSRSGRGQPLPCSVTLPRIRCPAPCRTTVDRIHQRGGVTLHELRQRTSFRCPRRHDGYISDLTLSRTRVAFQLDPPTYPPEPRETWLC